MKSEILKMLHKEIILPRIGTDATEIIEPKNDNESDLVKLIIKGLYVDSVEIKIDQPSTQLIEEFGENGSRRLSCMVDDDENKADKKCDIIIIDPPNNQGDRIMIGELKTKINKYSNFKTKLINSRIFIEYILALIKEHYGKESNPKFEYVVFYKKIHPKFFMQHKGHLNHCNNKSSIRLRLIHVQGDNPKISYNTIWQTDWVLAETVFV